MEYSDDQIKSIISDADYLVDEAEALIYVIDNVPVSEKAPGMESIIELIALIDHAQQTYYRPLSEHLFSVPNMDEKPGDFKSSFKLSDDEAAKPKEILKRISKNRASFIAFISKIPVDDLRIKGRINGQEMTIARLLEEMVIFERKQLKLVAERVLAIDNSLNQSRKPKGE
ncbi:MAG: hypothetical protein LAT84_00810 [Balneolia bacterium]|nr:hypothetical protein [Balneolia bacterium]